MSSLGFPGGGELCGCVAYCGGGWLDFSILVWSFHNSFLYLIFFIKHEFGLALDWFIYIYIYIEVKCKT